MPMLDIAQELMTPNEAARWFRRSASWLRQQNDLIKLGGPNGQPLYHTHACRAYVYGRMCELDGTALKRVQLDALAAACGIQGSEDRRRESDDSRANVLQIHAGDQQPV